MASNAGSVYFGWRSQKGDQNTSRWQSINKVDGVIGVTFSNVEKYIEDSSAYVSIERCLPGVPCVSCDNYGGGWMAADSLIRRGAKNLLFFQTISSVENEVRKRRYGFEACCEANDVAYGSVSFFRTAGTKYLLVLFCKKSDPTACCVHIWKIMEKERGPDGFLPELTIWQSLSWRNCVAWGCAFPENVQVIGYDGLKMLNTGRQLVLQHLPGYRADCKDKCGCLERLLNGEKVDNIINPSGYIY